MTNNATDLAPTLLDASGSTNNLITIVFDHGVHCVDLLAIFCAVLIVASPVFSIILCVRAWRRRRCGKPSPRSARIALSGALIMGVVTIVTVLNGLKYAFYFKATSEWGAAQEAMMWLNISHDLGYLMWGCLATAICLLSVICHPSRAQTESGANHGIEHTEVPRHDGCERK